MRTAAARETHSAAVAEAFQARNGSFQSADDDGTSPPENSSGEFAGNRSRAQSAGDKKFHKQEPLKELPTVVLEDLETIATLGTGTFGRVMLVQHRGNGEISALKCLQKAHLIRTGQQHNVRREKAAMMTLNALSLPFIVQLRGTLSDSNQVYLLLEYVPGGELWSILYNESEDAAILNSGPWGKMPLKSAMFFSAMCVSAFEHIHGLGFAYRDLKPENLLVAENGYLKLADYGFAKRIPYTSASGKNEDRTFTLCGTPEYMAPEIVLSRGHDNAVDYWALGILVYELLCGVTPFEAGSQQETFEKIVYSQRYLRFPLGFDPHAKSLVRKLLTSNSALRLGALKGGVNDLKNHLFFKNLDWSRLVKCEYEMDYKPTLSGAKDVRYFEGAGSAKQDELGVVEEFVVGSEGNVFYDF